MKTDHGYNGERWVTLDQPTLEEVRSLLNDYNLDK